MMSLYIQRRGKGSQPQRPGWVVELDCTDSQGSELNFVFSFFHDTGYGWSQRLWEGSSLIEKALGNTSNITTGCRGERAKLHLGARQALGMSYIQIKSLHDTLRFLLRTWGGGTALKSSYRDQ